MHNKVVTTLAKAAEKCGYMSLRFNFRGVGKSQGSYGEGIGELIDAQAALDYLQEAFRNNHDHKDDATQSPLLVLMGFSFGGYIAAQLCSMPTHTTPDALITIAPALHYEHLQLTQAPLCPWLVVHGEADEVISYAYNQKWLQEKAPQAQWIPFSDTGHFFHGKLIELQSTVQDFLSAWK
jgi:alpha/beta superfamily hydrolase